MSDNDWRQMLQERRLKHQLEIQSRQIEKVLSHHKVSAQVEGGTVQPRFISFDLREQLGNGIERIRGLTKDLGNALGVPDVRVQLDHGQPQLLVTRNESPPVALLDLLSCYPDLHSSVAALGLADDGSPVLLDFMDGNVTHVLVCGGAGAGKTALVRTIAMSLAFGSRQSQVQLLIMAPEVAQETSSYHELEPLKFLPHMLTTVGRSHDEVAQTMAFLVSEMEYRLEQQVNLPLLVTIIDDVDKVMEFGGLPFVEMLTHLLQRGEAAGIHMILSARSPKFTHMDELLKSNLPIRIVGQMPDAQTAAAASGMAGTGAEHLLTKGDFVATVNYDAPVHFQAAYIGDYDLHLCLEELHRRRPQPVLARPIDVRAALSVQAEPPGSSESDGKPFEFDGKDVETFPPEHRDFY